MEDKISVSNLASALASSTGKSKKLCEDFVKEFFRLVADSLEPGEALRIKGFGSFKIVDVDGRTGINVNTGERQEISPYKKVVFTPVKEIASEINAPFRDFESVEIEDEIPDDIFYDENLEPEEEISDEKNVSDQRLEIGSEEENEDDIITSEAYSYDLESATEEIKQPEEKEEHKPVEESLPPVQPKPFVSEPQTNFKEEPQWTEEEETPLPIYEEEKQKSRFGIGFLTGSLTALIVCVVVFMIGCFFNWWPVNFGNSKELIDEQSTELAQTVNDAETESDNNVEIPVEEPVYDTVSTTRYLTTIAREHYGDFNFWPYIYLENESILGHPDRITPGTKVVVPPLSKYGVDPSNKDDVAKAKQKGLEIYARYK